MSCSRPARPPLPQNFCDLVEMLLESHLAEIGISAEDFVEICMKAKAAGALNTDVIQQILAVEDFLSAYARCFHVCAISLCCVTV